MTRPRGSRPGAPRARGPRPRASRRCPRGSPPSPTYARTRPTAGRSPIARLRGHGPGHGPHPRTRAPGPTPARWCGCWTPPGQRSPSTTGWASSPPEPRAPSCGASPPTGRRSGRACGGSSRSCVRRGLVVLGAGSIPLATAGDREAFVRAAAADEPGALANNRYSADVVAIAGAGEVLARACPISPPTTRCRAGSRRPPAIPVRDLATRRRLAMDVDSPLDLVLLEGAARRAAAARSGSPVRRPRPRPPGGAARGRGGPGRRAARRRPDLAPPTCAGSSATRGREPGPWSRSVACGRPRPAPSCGRPNRRPPRSLLGALLDRDGPGALGRHVAALSDGALIDSRVLMAHRLGADEGGWPTAEDRFASDLLLAGPDRRPVAARAHGGGPRRARSRSCWAVTGSLGRACGSRSGVARGRATAVPYDRRDGRRSRPTRGVADPRPAPRPRVGRRGRGARRAHSRHDHVGGTDLVRPVHGPCPV